MGHITLWRVFVFWMLENLFACALVRPGSTASFKQPHVLLINAPICFTVKKKTSTKTKAQRWRAPVRKSVAHIPGVGSLASLSLSLSVSCVHVQNAVDFCDSGLVFCLTPQVTTLPKPEKGTPSSTPSVPPRLPACARHGSKYRCEENVRIRMRKKVRAGETKGSAFQQDASGAQMDRCRCRVCL